MATRKPVYFNDMIDGDLVEHCEKFGNFSSYVKRLIRMDLDQNLTKWRGRGRPVTKRNDNPPPTPPKLFRD